jgi:hypothetical protein
VSLGGSAASTCYAGNRASLAITSAENFMRMVVLGRLCTPTRTRVRARQVEERGGRTAASDRNAE